MKKIKKYFKNAKKVECLLAGIYEIDLKTIYKDKGNHYWCKCKDSTDHCLLFEDGDFAQIIEVKKKKVETVSRKQTSVEWFIEKIITQKNDDIFVWDSIYEQAKEMEKQQLKDCWNASDENMRSQFSSSEYKRITFEQWLGER